MRIPPPADLPKYFTTFSVDAMFYHGARTAFASAKDAKEGIVEAEEQMVLLERDLDELREEFDIEEGSCDMPSGYYDALEPLALEMEGAEHTIVESDGPVLQQLSLVHILCVAALEAHINIRATGRLTGREWKAFERSAVDAKWLFFPRLLGVAGFDPGQEPFQGLDRL